MNYNFRVLLSVRKMEYGRKGTNHKSQQSNQRTNISTALSLSPTGRQFAQPPIFPMRVRRTSSKRCLPCPTIPPANAWMRVCFDGLCFTARKPATDDDCTQIGVVQYGGPNDNNGFIAAHTLPTSPSDNQIQSKAYRTVIDSQLRSVANPEGNLTLAAIFGVEDKSAIMQQPNSNNPFVTVTVDDDHLPPINQIQPPQPPVLDNVVLNEQFSKLSAQAASNGVVNLAGPIAPVGPDPVPSGASDLTAEYVQMIKVRDVRINELENQLRRKEEEMAELKSHLDKFQSVFPFSRGRKSKAPQGPQRQRAQGISAEPQSESSIRELMNITFAKYDKEER